MPDQKFPSPEEFLEGQLLLINKPLEWTSFQAVHFIRSCLRRYTGQKKIKVGHAGTLDPLATGLLLVCTGRKTKEIEQFMGLPKEYTGRMQIGSTRPSHDRETEIGERFETSDLNEELIQEAMGTFSGWIEQVPPVFSAIRKQGKRLYESARKGALDEGELQARKVFVEEFKMEAYDAETALLTFSLKCSKGTYVRSLARDLGSALNNGAHLESLRRTRIGPYDLSEALEPKTWAAAIPRE
jgi:tRNA pseudouridine55 synthase